MELQPKIIEHLQHTAQFIFVPTNETDYEQLVSLLDELIDMVRDDEKHPLANLMDVLGSLIEHYEAEHSPEPSGNSIDVLKHFMAQHNLQPSHLKELGSPHVVMEILNGSRGLTLDQVRLLSQRFKVSAAVFV